MKIRRLFLATLSVLGLVLVVFGLLARLHAVQAQEILPVMKGVCTSVYTITNQGSGTATTLHAFYNEFDQSVYQFGDTIVAGMSKVYDLADIAQLPDGYVGYVIVSSDQPYTYTLDTCPGTDTTPPAAIPDLSATPSTYPGDIILSWTASGDDSDSGTASEYMIKYWLGPITTEDEWNAAWDLDGEPTPLPAGAMQSMAVSLIPNHTYHFAIKAIDEVPNISSLSNSASTKAPGMLVSDINTKLALNPSAILDQEVTVLVMPVRTDDWTLGFGDISTVLESFKLIEVTFDVVHNFIEKGGSASFVALIKGVLIKEILGNWLQMRAQLVWGLHENEYNGDPTLVVWDPSAPLMDHGVPYVVTGTVRKKPFFDILTLKEDFFYYLKVEHSGDQVVQQPSTTHLHFTIPIGYTYHNWEDIHLDGVTGYGDQICTIGFITERYPLDGYHYVRIQLMERISGALVVRVPANEVAPDMGTMALYCGTKKAANGDNLHPGWLPIAKYLDTTTGQGGVQVLQGTVSQIVGHERQPMTFLGIEIGSPVDIHLYDSEGKHVGVIYDSIGNVIGIENEIPNVEYFYGLGDTPELMSIGNPTDGAYTVTIRGTDTGTYTQTIRIFDPSGGQTYSSTIAARPTSSGQEDTIVVDELPAAPTGLRLEMNGNTINLDWDDNTENDLAGYNVYRSMQVDGIYQKMSPSLLTSSFFVDNSANINLIYYYYVTAVDTDNNESGFLSPVANKNMIYLPVTLK